MSETLFSQVERTQSDLREDTKPLFEYLDRSARPEMARVRDVLEAWFTQYPDTDRHEFKRRCQANNSKFTSAFFELYLHALLLRLGYSVEVQPEGRTPNSGCPDFFVQSRDGEQFILEATVASGTSDKEAAQIQRMSQTRDALNSIDSPKFFISIETEGAPNSAPPIKSWKQKVSVWLGSLDLDEIVAAWDDKGTDAQSPLILSHDGWHMQLYAIPKSVNLREKPGIRTIGMVSGEIQRIHTKEIIRNAVTAKAKRYGKPDMPYIIAVNVCTPICKHIDIMEALFGTEQYIIPAETDQAANQPRVTIRRKRDGAWMYPLGPRYKRVSAVLVAHNLLPWTVASQDVWLYHNPWADHRYNGKATQLSAADPKEQRMYWKKGVHPRELFGLPVNWPE